VKYRLSISTMKQGIAETAIDPADIGRIERSRIIRAIDVG
jgi:hypothetical protein